MKKTLFVFALLYSAFMLNAQQGTVKCGEAYVEQTLAAHFGSYENIRASYLEEIAKYNDQEQGAENVYTIPVVVHVIYDNPENNITRAQVLDAINVLNRDYRRQNADTANTRSTFKPVAADIEVEFALAKLDPNGNCTEGITRTFSTLTNNAFNNVKPLSQWNNRKYLNIWVVQSINSSSTPGTILGYAYKPVPGGQPFSLDGIVIRHDQMGTIGTAVAGGRTLVHEAGHYLGLDHPFRNGCFSGDGCSDTPPVASSNSGCNFNSNTCSNDVPDLPDQVENYMDYSDDECTNMFTICQRGKMRATLASSNLRGNLVSGNNETETGIAVGQVLPCAPTADFASDKQLICEGESIAFEDLTYFGNATNMQWTFAGGNPATSTSKNPIVSYSQKGSYMVELIATNANGSSTKTYRGFVAVRSQTNTPYINTFGDDFEAFPIPNENWHVSPGLDTMNFRYFSKTAFAGQSCVTVQNFGAINKEVDAMESHMIDVSGAQSINLNFQIAFAETALGNNDRLRIYVSNDCGMTWNLESNRQGPLLRSTNVRHDTAWWPTSNADWKQVDVDLSAYAMNPNYIMIRFEFENGGGNNFYMDEVLLTTTIGTEEDKLANSVKVYPNPADNWVRVDLHEINQATVNLLDVTGKLLLSKNSSRENSLQFDVSNLRTGLYILQIESNGFTTNQKLIVQ